MRSLTFRYVCTRAVAEVGQPFGQDVAGDSESLLDLLEPPKALVHVADDQEAPLLPDDVQCASNRTVHVGEGPRGHGFTIVHSGAERCFLPLAHCLLQLS